MVIFHCCYDVFMVYGQDPSWYSRPAVHIWQQSICWTFILISGFVWSWGRSGNLKRGIMLNVWGLVISGVTVLAMPAEAVWFGILNCIGCAVLLMIPMEPVLRRIPAAIGLVAAFALFAMFKDVQLGISGRAGRVPIGFARLAVRLPRADPVRFPVPGFRSSDYFPICRGCSCISAGIS